MGRTRIKICGVRDLDGALAAVEAGADALGFNFIGSSPRLVTPAQALEIARFLPPFVTKVALFAAPTLDELLDVGEVFPFDVLQLHGDEDEAGVRACRELGLPILKAVRFHADTIERELERWGRVGEIDALLVDGSTGGKGARFDWSALARVQDRSAHPIVVAGGLNPSNVGVAVRELAPYAVDVSSGVEREKAVKDPDLMDAFCRAVRQADR
jgi:phosphoribosylanthranilate isomerase